MKWRPGCVRTRAILEAPISTKSRGSDPGIAAVLSLLVPGVGQFYTGHFIWGLFWLILTGGSWIFTAGCFAFPCHVLASMQAFSQGRAS